MYSSGGNPSASVNFTDPADEQLWARLSASVRSAGLSINDVHNCDNPSKLRLFHSLGFQDGEAQTLLRIASQKDAGSKVLTPTPSFTMGSPSPAAASMSSAAPPLSMMASPGGASQGAGYSLTAPPQPAMTSPYAAMMMNVGAPPAAAATSSAVSPQVGFGSPNPAMASPYAAAPSPPPPQPFGMAAAAPAPTQPQPYFASGSNVPRPQPTPYSVPASVPQQVQQGAIRGLSMVGDQLIARCSVYPELPAEFWCCACNVLVSSRCHVQGIHKDHPFITMRLAAEAHVRDLTAWSERCRTQLNVTESVLSNLRHAEGVVQQQGQREFDQLEAQVQQVVQDLMRWKEQLRADMQAQLAAQAAAIQTAARRTEELLHLYSTQLHTCEPLMANVPPVDQADRSSEDWALRVLDFVSKLKSVNTEPVPMPRLLVPEVVCSATPATHMELLKCVSKPVGVRLPDLLDPGYFNFPQPAASARVPFTLAAPDDAAAKGIVVYNGRTLTRSQDVVPSHTLVTGSQVFYSGVASWEVHVDRLGTGPGRVLAGVVIHGSDGEGIVWDGQRIVGPNEGECRTLDDRYQVRPGTVLRFVLELEGPACYLGCFFDRDGVARIPIPATGNGWVPAFSVFGPQDQITVVPTSATQRAELEITRSRSSRTRVDDPDEARRKLQEQEHLIASLQQQLNAVHARIDNEQYARTVADVQERNGDAVTPIRGVRRSSGAAAVQVPSSPAFVAPTARDIGLPPTPIRPAGLSSLPNLPASTPQRTASVASSSSPARVPVEAYSPELKQLMKFVSDVR